MYMTAIYRATIYNISDLDILVKSFHKKRAVTKVTVSDSTGGRKRSTNARIAAAAHTQKNAGRAKETVL